LYKLLKLEKCLKDYQYVTSSGNDFDYDFYKEKQLEVIDLLRQFAEEVNISKIIPNYLLQLKISPVHSGWRGRSTKRVHRQGTVKNV
jgi:hypothetical protein